MALVNGDLSAARAAIADQVKFDILTETQEVDNENARNEIARSFISDTITVPSKEMYTYASLASVGDDVYHEPCTLALEVHMAKLTGKEAALFVPSGTMSNQLALRTHLKQPPYSVLCDHRGHINCYEAGGIAFHSGAHTIPVIPSNGHHLTLADVEEHITLGTDLHWYEPSSSADVWIFPELYVSATTEVIALENTLNGTIFPQDEIVKISQFAHTNGLKMHLDGARLWHVAAETGTPLKTLCDPFDSVSLCFSKGLGAPVGSCLVGSTEFIRKARWFRKLFGGGMRQTGVLSASAAYALTHNFPQLPRVHELTRRLESGLKELGVKITSGAETCMVFINPTPLGISYQELVTRASELPAPIKLGGSRLVVHIQTSPQAVEDLIELVRVLADEKAKAGFVPSSESTSTASQSIYVRSIRAEKKA
ncbi:pyridoxal phosphate-dependent transferase [Cytidiella melzeri]|nr:pyridoxal phosphate-dependent transferase [Cytidiella melzeri]